MESAYSRIRLENEQLKAQQRIDDMKIADLEAAVRVLETRVSYLQEEIQGKDEKIRDLEVTITSNEMDLDNLDYITESLREELDRAEEQIRTSFVSGPSGDQEKLEKALLAEQELSVELAEAHNELDTVNDDLAFVMNERNSAKDELDKEKIKSKLLIAALNVSEDISFDFKG